MASIPSDPLHRTQDPASPNDSVSPASVPYLFVILHYDSPLLGAARYDLTGLDQVTLGRGPERRAERHEEDGRQHLKLQLPDGLISATHACLVRKDDDWVLEDANSKNGCFINGERVSSAPLRAGDFIEIGGTLLRFRSCTLLPGHAGDFDTAVLSAPIPGLLTILPELSAQLEALGHMAARSVMSVLLLGETGTGKEVLARAVHTLSGRRGAFVAVNCGGLEDNLLKSQLFGHLKGAYTGATRDERGYVRAADRGTLFLDEIGDLPLDAQAALLRVLQEREVVPVGDTRPVKVDVRVIAATHRPLDDMVAQGTFRSDLLARLSGYRHLLTPLRERREDLGVLIAELLRRSGGDRANEIRISLGAGRLLVRHDWPRNIRELEQCLAAAALLAKDGLIEPAQLPSVVREAPPMRPSLPEEYSDPEKLRQVLITLLERHRGRVTHVAREMGKARMQIHRWMQKLDIDPNDYRK
jgi:transcriptional regulator with AAA-type ATPase domain